MMSYFRFELSSTEAGLIASCYDIAGSIAILFVTYVGGNGHKPQWIGWGMFLIGLSGVVFSLPHFVAPPYIFTDILNLCGSAEPETCSISALKNFRCVDDAVVYKIKFINSSDGRMNKASTVGAVHSGLIPSLVEPMTANCYSQLPCLTLSIKGTVWRTSRQVYLLCRCKICEKILSGIPSFSSDGRVADNS